MKPIKFSYKIYKGFPCPIVSFQVQTKTGWKGVDAYVDSGASVSVFSLQDAARLDISYKKGKIIYNTVGDGSLIPVYLHKLPVKIGNVSLKATIGFSPRLGVGFNLLGRKDIFSRFDVLFSDRAKTVSFLPRS
jgi:hypothetical protein